MAIVVKIAGVTPVWFRRPRHFAFRSRYEFYTGHKIMDETCVASCALTWAWTDYLGAAKCVIFYRS